MFIIFLHSRVAFLVHLDILSFMKNNYTFDTLRRVCEHKTEICTNWQIGRLLVQGTWLGLVTRSVTWGSMWPTCETSNNSVIIRLWRCLLLSGPSLTLPYTNSWLKTHFVLLAKIIAYVVFQLSLLQWFV